MVCLKALLRLATTNMDTEQCKELASFVSVLSNDKIKAEREKDKKKTTAKKATPKKPSAKKATSKKPAAKKKVSKKPTVRRR